MITIAVVGLSGVGKSTLIQKAADRMAFLHLQASALIKAEQAALRQSVSSSEELRLGSVSDNQALLVAAFSRAVKGYEGVVVFDGHTIIDGANGPIEIPSSVFGGIACDHIIFLRDDPAVILRRREADRARYRREISVDELAKQQGMALNTALRIGRELDIGVTTIPAGDAATLIATVSTLVGTL